VITLGFAALRDSGEDQYWNRIARLALSVQASRGAPSETHANDPKQPVSSTHPELAEPAKRAIRFCCRSTSINTGRSTIPVTRGIGV
jgi:hypothetical protein